MATDLTTLPLVIMTSAGPQPQQPANLLSQLLTLVSAASPGYTANLPGILIEDISSTDVAAISMTDQAYVDTVNSLNPATANPFVLNQLGANCYGVPVGQLTNTSVYVVFSSETLGYIIPRGFTVSDGSFNYVVQDGGVVGGSGSTVPLFCSATQTGSWPVAANTVTQIKTTVPFPYIVTCNNPLAGTPQAAPQTEEDYRSRVLLAGRSPSIGAQSTLKTALGKVPGVQTRLVSVKQLTGEWEVIVGGTADPYAIAAAIYNSIADISLLVGSEIQVTGYTVANPGVITTNLNHGFVNGNTATVAGATPSGYNSTGVVTVITPTTFSIAHDTSGLGAYVGGGIVTPNARNQVISLVNPPDVYSVPFVVPPLETVIVALTWNTTATNTISDAAVQQAGAIGIAAYIDSIPVGQPINQFELINAFQLAMVGLIPTELITRMIFTVEINGIMVSPESGTGIIPGDPESYLSTTTASITITQG